MPWGTKPDANAELEADKQGESPHSHAERRFPWITLVGTTASQAERLLTDSLRDGINALGEEDMEGHSTASASDSMATTVPWMAATAGTPALFPNLAGGTQLDLSESPTEQAFAAVRGRRPSSHDDDDGGSHRRRRMLGAHYGRHGPY